MVVVTEWALEGMKPDEQNRRLGFRSQVGSHLSYNPHNGRVFLCVSSKCIHNTLKNSAYQYLSTVKVTYELIL